MSMMYKEYNQTLKLFKKVKDYGENKVIVSSSGWYEYEHAILKNTSAYFCMLPNGSFLCIGKPEDAHTCCDDCIIMRITNLENVD